MLMMLAYKAYRADFIMEQFRDGHGPIPFEFCVSFSFSCFTFCLLNVDSITGNWRTSCITFFFFCVKDKR